MCGPFSSSMTKSKKQLQGKVGMEAGRGSSHSSSASTCRNRRRYVTSPVKQRHEAVKSGISEKSRIIRAVHGKKTLNDYNFCPRAFLMQTVLSISGPFYIACGPFKC